MDLNHRPENNQGHPVAEVYLVNQSLSSSPVDKNRSLFSHAVHIWGRITVVFYPMP